jgi:hypothetical protein
MSSSSNVQYHVIFHPMSSGVGDGNRAPMAEISSSYSTLKAALRSRSAPPEPGYIAVKITDGRGHVIRERTAGQHIAGNGSVW